MGRHSADVLSAPGGDHLDDGADSFSGRDIAADLLGQPADPGTETASSFYSKIAKSVGELEQSEYQQAMSPEAIRLAALIEARAQQPSQTLLTGPELQLAASPTAETDTRKLVEHALVQAAKFLTPQPDGSDPGPVELLASDFPESAITSAALQEIEDIFEASPLVEPDNANSTRVPSVHEIPMKTAIKGVRLITRRSYSSEGPGDSEKLSLVILRTPVAADAVVAHPAAGAPAPVVESLPEPEQREARLDTAVGLYESMAKQTGWTSANSISPDHHGFLPKLAKRIRNRAKVIGENLLPADIYDPEIEQEVVRTGVHDAIFKASWFLERTQVVSSADEQRLFETTTEPTPATKIMVSEIGAILGAESEGVTSRTQIDGREVSVQAIPTAFDGIELQRRRFLPVRADKEQNREAIPGKLVLTLVRTRPIEADPDPTPAQEN